MEKSLTTYKDDPNEVDKTGFGFGPIHYLITEKHANRKELLICLAMYSRADLDLTTTELREVTALHLACKVRYVIKIDKLLYFSQAGFNIQFGHALFDDNELHCYNYTILHIHMQHNIDALH